MFLNNNFTSYIVLSLFFDSILQSQERIIYVFENVAFKRHTMTCPEFGFCVEIEGNDRSLDFRL